MIRRILLAYDGSAGADRALEFAFDLARSRSSKPPTACTPMCWSSAIVAGACCVGWRRLLWPSV